MRTCDHCGLVSLEDQTLTVREADGSQTILCVNRRACWIRWQDEHSKPNETPSSARTLDGEELAEGIGSVVLAS